jgi:hypothetical protein
MRLHRLRSAPTHDSEWGGGGIEAPDQGALSSAARIPETVARFRKPFKRMALPILVSVTVFGLGKKRFYRVVTE